MSDDYAFVVRKDDLPRDLYRDLLTANAVTSVKDEGDGWLRISSIDDRTRWEMIRGRYRWSDGRRVYRRSPFQERGIRMYVDKPDDETTQTQTAHHVRMRPFAPCSTVRTSAHENDGAIANDRAYLDRDDMLVGIGSMEGSSHVSRGIAATKSSSSKRTKSGERRISVGSDPSKITRQSETFRIPEEARRSKPSIEASSFVSETVRCQVPTSVKLLSLPTPHQEFEPARHLETRPSPRFTPRRLSKLQEVGNAVALFVFLIATSVIAVRLVAVALFG